MGGTSYGQYGSSGGGGGGGGVTSLNTETGDLTITAGTNVAITTPTSTTIQVGLTTGNLTDAGTDGITVTGGTGAVVGGGTAIAQHVADVSHNGYLSSTDWATFNGKQSALTIGNISDIGTDGITVTGGTGAIIGSGVTLSQHVADTTHNGYLSSTDWNTFNGKQAAGNYVTAGTGDATFAGPGSAAVTFATVNSNVGSFTNASLTVNAKGLVTAASSGTTGNLTDAGTDGITVTGGTGAVLGSGTSIAQHVADSAHNGYLSSTDWSTFNAKGSGTVTAVSVASANGFAGSSGGGATPALTISTSITGVLKGNGTAISAATAGADYSAGTSALATGILKSTTTTGALTIAVSGTDYAPGVLTTKGDLYGFSSVNARIPIGTDTYVLTADSSQTLGLKWALPSSSPRSSVTVSNGNGQGSTNTKIRRWTNIRLNTGTDITYADSATLGGSFTVNTAGVYTISCSDGASSSTVLFGITVNNSAPTTDIASLTYAQGVRATVQTGSAAETGFVSWTGILAANDVLQMAGGGSPVPDETSTARSICTVTKVSN